MAQKKKITEKRKPPLSKKKLSAPDEIPNNAEPVAEPDMIVQHQPDFPIVGIGASAGGLAAFEAFFSGMPADKEIGMAFVLVQHLAPDHKSILTELVKRYTRMEVFEVTDGMTVRPDCAYIIPPNHDMAFMNGNLQLLEPTAPRGQRLPIDFFFRSLAQDQRERAICIVLSGTGSDGTLGIRSIKGEGGMVMAQAPESTEYDGMPRSAIATGLVDYVLPPADMPAQLIAYVAHAFGQKISSTAALPPKAEDALKKIFILLRNKTGHDFSRYKQNTIARRIERRMALHQIDLLEGYVRYLQQNPGEIDALFCDMLIGVTSFFRDPEAFDALREKVIPSLFAGRPVGATIRVWVPGCSTGEEAYSIAIMLHEYLDEVKRNFHVQVFATDIDSKAIEVARAGVYPASISSDILPERLARFFSPGQDSGTYRIQKGIRDMLVFSEQDIIKDPPFSKLDLISCRNLLIYMGGDLQKKLIPLFHYSLNPGGALFLGNSETVGEFLELFATVDRKWKLYQRKEDTPGVVRPVAAKFLPPLIHTAPALNHPGKTRPEGKPVLRELAEQELLAQYAPAGIVVNEHGEILYIHGHTGKYLEPAPGEAGMNILKMAREGLQRKLAAALHKAVTGKAPVHYPGVRVKTNGDFSTINLKVQQITPPDGQPGNRLFLIIFEEAPVSQNLPAASIAADAGESATDSNERIQALEQELRIREEYLQTTIEEMETSNEELKSSNEEMQSVNEELQSTNEELETSKEELQSVNEELATVNAELQQKVAELSRVNNDMNNLLAGTGVGTVFVDQHLRIQRFTPAATRVINLIQTDVGRPVSHIVTNFTGYDRLVEDTKEVLSTLIPKEVEVQIKAGGFYFVRILPYRTLENVIEGVVLTFIDITEMKRIQDALRKSDALRRLAVVVSDSRDAILVQDLSGRIMAWNPGAERMYGWTEAEALTMNISDLVPEGLRDETPALVRKLGWAEVLEPYRTQRKAKDDRTVEVLLIATVLVHDNGEAYAIATTERAVTKEQ